MDNEFLEKQMKNALLFNKALFIIGLLVTIYCLATSSYLAAFFFSALSFSGFVGMKQDRNKMRNRFLKLQGKMFAKDSPIFDLNIEVRSNRRERTKSDSIRDLELPSSEKIKRVAIQDMPINDKETIFAKRHHKEYIITVTPQAKDCFEFDLSKKITVTVIAGSKGEAFDELSHKLSGRYSFTDQNSNVAESGRWYDGNKYILEIIKFEKCRK